MNRLRNSSERKASWHKWVGLAVVPALVLALSLVAGALPRVHNSSGARFLTDVEKIVDSGNKEKLKLTHKLTSPIATVMAARLALAASVSPAASAQVVGLVHLCLLAALVYLFACLLVPWYAALLAVGLLLSHPLIVQGSLESVPSFVVLFYLCGPALLLGLGLSSRGAGRLVLCLLAGLVAGASIFAYHLGLWTAVLAVMAMFVTRPTDREPGVVVLPDLGLEFAAVLAGFVVAFLACKVGFAAETKSLADYLFFGFKAFHPPMQVAGIEYREVVDGGPPWWTAWYHLVVRMPPLLLLGLAGGLYLLAVNLFDDHARLLWLPASTFVTVLTVTTLCGSHRYQPGFDALMVAAPFVVLLASYGFWCLCRVITRKGAQAGVVELTGLSLLACLALGHQMSTDIRYAPYPAWYVNVLGGGTAQFAASNDMVLEPTLDEDGAAALASFDGKVVVAPWGTSIQRVLDRFSRESDTAPVRARNGGPFPVLVMASPSSALLDWYGQYCKDCRPVASLNVGSVAVWRLFEH